MIKLTKEIQDKMLKSAFGGARAENAVDFQGEPCLVCDKMEWTTKEVRLYYKGDLVGSMDVDFHGEGVTLQITGMKFIVPVNAE